MKRNKMLFGIGLLIILLALTGCKNPFGPVLVINGGSQYGLVANTTNLSLCYYIDNYKPICLSPGDKVSCTLSEDIHHVVIYWVPDTGPPQVKYDNNDFVVDAEHNEVKWHDGTHYDFIISLWDIIDG